MIEILHKTPNFSLVQIIEIFIMMICFALEADVAICFIVIMIDDKLE